MSDTTVDVLVVGAGPSGLALALAAHDHGARVRVVERRREPFRPSRALIVHPRTLEVLAPLGVTDALLAGGDVSPTVHLHLGVREIPVQLGHVDIPDTAFPHLLFIRQAVVEGVLADALAGRGISVEWGTRLAGLRATATGADATLRRGTEDDAGDRRGSDETVRCRFVAGCDGPDSDVRTFAGIDWKGRSYHQEVVLADLELEGDLAPGVAHVVAGRGGVLFVFAIGERATWRLLGTRPARAAADLAPGRPAGPVPASELTALVADAGLDAAITEVAWSARVPLQHGVAAQYRRGPLFLVGDAAHVHSPAGGQGMNTGIQDALNLGWKLGFAASAAATSGVAPVPLLDSYEIERRPIARRTRLMTNAMFWGEAGTDPVVSFARGALAPLAGPLVPHLLGWRSLVASGVRLLGQLNVSYRGSPLSVDASPKARGKPRPGDRLADETVTVAGSTRRLHQLLAGPGLAVLLARDAAEPGEDALGPLVGIHRVTSWPGRGVVIARPDGYVGFRSAAVDLRSITDWLALVGAAPAAPRPR